MNTMKQNTVKTFGFDTERNFAGLTDMVGKIIKASDGTQKGADIPMNEMLLDEALVSTKTAALTVDVAIGDTTVTVAVADLPKFAMGAIVSIKEGATDVFPVDTKIKTINSTTGVIELSAPAIATATSLGGATIAVSRNTGLYQGNITGTHSDATGTFYIYVVSPSIGMEHNYGMIEIVQNDIDTVKGDTEIIKASLAGGTGATFGKFLI